MAFEKPTHTGRRESIHGSSLSDGATDKDTLGFEVYVEAIRAYLTHADTKGPLSLSIEGEWGSGKTSFMKMLRQQLQGAKTVWFNAWRHDREEELWAAFAGRSTPQLRQGVEKMLWTRLMLAVAIVVIDGAVFFVPLTAFVAAYLILFRPRWFKQGVDALYRDRLSDKWEEEAPSA